MNRLKLLVCACAVYSVIDANAQRNFYHRLDVGSANVYTFVLSNLLTGYANYLSGDMLFDNSYVYTLYDGSMDGGKIRTKGFNPMGITATELFNDAFAGVKLGYQSDRLGFLNWGRFCFRALQDKSDSGNVPCHGRLWKGKIPVCEDRWRLAADPRQYGKPDKGTA